MKRGAGFLAGAVREVHDMRNEKAGTTPTKLMRLMRSGFMALFLAMILAGTANAQDSQVQTPSGAPAAGVEDYKIGPGDVLTVSVADAPEFGGKFRVSDNGMIEIAGVSAALKAEGQSATELAHTIHQALVDAKQLRDPHVGVFVDEYHGRTVTVLGAVTKPAVYPIERRTTVLEALSLAGGTIPNAGNTITVVRGAASAEAAGTAVGSVQILRMSDLMSGTERSANFEVKNGDVVSVSAAQFVYVVGAVIKPGGYAMTDPTAGVSVVQAVALASGLNGVANTHHALVVRQSTSDHGRVEIPVDVGLMMAGKTTDVTLAPNDILFIPNSGTKQTLKVMEQFALAAATGITIYGLGYQLAGVKP
jgi:polysaccharide export outer membrane protein